MKCPDCGANYTGKRCPICGKVTDPDLERRRKRIVAGTIGGIAVAVVIVICVTYTLHSTNRFYDDLSNQLTEILDGEPIGGQSDVSASKTTFVPETGDNSETISEIKAALSDYFQEENVSVFSSQGKTIINASSSDITASVNSADETGGSVEEWDSIKEALCKISTALPLIPNTTAAVLYVKEYDGDDIYMTISGGSVLHDALEEVKQSNYGPGYMTLAIYNQIQNGMSYQEVVNLVGAQGTVLSDVDLGNSEYRTTMYSWEGQGTLGANASVTFQGDKVIGKAQFGLE